MPLIDQCVAGGGGGGGDAYLVLESTLNVLNKLTEPVYNMSCVFINTSETRQS